MILVAAALAQTPGGEPPSSAPPAAAAAVTPAPPSPEFAAWEAAVVGRATGAWSGCVFAIPRAIPLPGPTYTTVAEADIGADGVPSAFRLVRGSGSDAVDACVAQAFSGGGFPRPPPAAIVGGNPAHIAEIKMTVRVVSSPAGTLEVPTGPVVVATLVPGVDAKAAAGSAVMIAASTGGTRNLWCGASGCTVRDARGKILVYSVTVCRRGDELRFGTAYGPMSVAGGASVLPDAAACVEAE